MAEAEVKTSDLVVSAVGLVKEFRDFWNRPKAKAVNDLDFEVREGEVLGLPNSPHYITHLQNIDRSKNESSL